MLKNMEIKYNDANKVLCQHYSHFFSIHFDISSSQPMSESIQPPVDRKQPHLEVTEGEHLPR